MTMMQQSAIDRQDAMAAEHRVQLLQRDMETQLLRMQAGQDLAAERARNRALQDANMKAMWDKIFNQR